MIKAQKYITLLFKGYCSKKILTLRLKKGEFVAITGESGKW